MLSTTMRNIKSNCRSDERKVKDCTPPSNTAITTITRIELNNQHRKADPFDSEAAYDDDVKRKHCDRHSNSNNSTSLSSIVEIIHEDDQQEISAPSISQETPTTMKPSSTPPQPLKDVATVAQATDATNTIANEDPTLMATACTATVSASHLSHFRSQQHQRRTLSLNDLNQSLEGRHLPRQESSSSVLERYPRNSQKDKEKEMVFKDYLELLRLNHPVRTRQFEEEQEQDDEDEREEKAVSLERFSSVSGAEAAGTFLKSIATTRRSNLPYASLLEELEGLDY